MGRIKQLLLLLLVTGFMTASCWAQESLVITTAPPKGFDDLLEPQLTMADIWFNGRYLGGAMISYTPEHLSFEDPHEILTWLGDVKSTDEILTALSLPLATNQHKICRYQEQPDCGLLSPDVLGVIFDEANFRVDIFINPKYLPQTKISIEKYLPDSTSGPALINQLSFYASGQHSGENNYSAVVESLASWKNYRLRSNLQADNNESLQLERLSLAWERKNFIWQAGSFRNKLSHQSQLAQRDMLGFRVATSLNSRTDLEQVSGTRLTLFLQERSRIEAYKDGQLIASRIYPPGNIELDSRDFPDGAYNVRLVIKGDSGREREELQFFSKSTQLVPKGEHQFFFESGYFEKIPQSEFYPERDSPLIFRTGYGARPFDAWGYNLTLNSTHRQNLLEINNTLLGNATELQSTIGVSDDGDYSLLNQLDIRLPEFFVSLNYRKSIAAQSTQSDRLNHLSDINTFRFIDGNSRQISFVAGIPLAGGNINLIARSSESQFIERSESYGLSWQQNLFRRGNLLLDLNLDLTHDNHQSAVYTGFVLRYNTLRWQASGAYSNGREALSEQWHDTARFDGQLGYRYYSNRVGQWNSNLLYNQSRQIVQQNQSFEQVQNQSLSWRNEIRNDYGFGRVELEQVKRDGSSNAGYVVESRFNLVTTASQMSLGGDQQNSAGVMISLANYDNPDLFFAVLINGQERALIRPGHASFIALEPYHHYRLQLSPRGSALVQFDDGVKEFTLYPGNVEDYVFKLEASRVFIMQVVDQKLRPLPHANALLENGYGRTDAQGWTQLELTQHQQLRFKTQNGECLVAIDWQRFRQTVNYLDQVICQPVNH